MRCLRCDATLQARPAGRRALAHACLRDHGALVLGDHAPHALPVAPLARLQESMRGAPGGPHPCPACGKEMRLARVVRHGTSIEVDACASCGALWFDAGELDALRTKERGPAGAPAARPEGAMGLAGAEAAAGFVVDPRAWGGIADLIGAFLDN